MASNLRIYLYKDCNESNLNIEELRQFIQKSFGFSEIILRGKFFNFYLKNHEIDEIAKKLAAIKVKDVFQPYIEYSPLIGEIEFEKRQLTKKNKHIKGILYDGLKLILLCWDFLPNDKKVSDFLHIIITDRLFGTYFKGDGRYHVRTIICSRLSLISTAGIVEGPAKPRLFYKMKQQSAAMGVNIPIEIFKEQFKGQFIDYDDPNLTEVLKGYISQILFFNLSGEPFCSDKTCRLFNAHWQSDLINAQLVHKKFCVEHSKFLEELKNKNLDN